MDYRQLNDATVKDAYPLPRIDDTLDMLAGKQWFSTLDLASGYWQVSLSQDARAKTAFATHSGLFQFRVMPFGLCNAPATFERLMDRVLQGLRWSRCLVYLDDIISFGGTFGAALSNLTLIFERLRSYGLQLKSSKCHLFRESVPFLGHIVGRRGLECDPKKIEDVKSWPVPDCLKSVRQFLGFVGYYRRFIPKFADVATPLVHLTGKDVPFVWDTSCSAAFQALRASLIDAPILAFPTETGQYILDTDASNFGLGGVLSQIQDDRELVVAYCSRALRDAGDVTPDPSVDVSAWEGTSVLHPGSDIINDLDKPIDLDGHILSPFYPREIIYQNCTFLSIAHLMCYRYAVINNQKTFATGIRKWSRPLRDFPTPKFSTNTEIEQWKTILAEIYEYLCISDSEFRSTLVHSQWPFTVAAKSPWGPETGTATPQRGFLNDILIDLRVAASHDRLKAGTWLGAGGIKVHDTRHARR